MSAVLLGRDTELDALRSALQGVAERQSSDVLPYLVGTPATYSFAAFNGPSLADNAPEAMLSLVTDRTVPTGHRPSVAAHYRAKESPYVVLARALVEQRA